jgi:dTDP-4-dehydrorhamnose 3,5-epimerase-like enzyme
MDEPQKTGGHNRPNSLTFRHRMRLVLGENSPSAVVVPPGVVHGYRNIGQRAGLVVNLLRSVLWMLQTCRLELPAKKSPW